MGTTKFAQCIMNPSIAERLTIDEAPIAKSLPSLLKMSRGP